MTDAVVQKRAVFNNRENKAKRVKAKDPPPRTRPRNQGALRPDRAILVWTVRITVVDGVMAAPVHSAELPGD